MTDPLSFLLAALALLITPGPTNTLLLTSGAAGGFRLGYGYVLSLMIAEVSGYMLAIVGLALALGPVARSSPLVDGGLRLAAGAYLAWIAVGLWRNGVAAVANAEKAITPRQVFVTTTLNPKGSIFAFVILPYAADGDIAMALPYLSALVCCIVTVATGWISAGMILKRLVGGDAGFSLVCRASAAVLAVLAMVVSLSAIQRYGVGG